MEFLTIKLVKAEHMFAIDAKEKGYRVNNCHNHTQGYEITYEDGYKSWCPVNVFLDNAISNNPEYNYPSQCPDWAPDYLKRMYEEFNELMTKCVNLDTFINGDKFQQLDIVQKNNLKLQYKFMLGYINVLGIRIKIEYKHNMPGEDMPNGTNVE